jgi:hypothetical protein
VYCNKWNVLLDSDLISFLCCFRFYLHFSSYHQKRRERDSKSDENASGSGRLRHFVCLYKKKLLFDAADNSSNPQQISRCFLTNACTGVEVSVSVFYPSCLCWGDFPGAKWSGSETDYLPPSSTEVQNGGAVRRLPPHVMSWFLSKGQLCC